MQDRRPLTPHARRAAGALAFISSRFSVSPKRLIAPGPTPEQLQSMIEAAGCAPDHELMRPWRLLYIAASEREALAHVFVRSLLERIPDASAETQTRARDKAFRAPDLLLAVARLDSTNINVPEWEQYVALGAALQNLLLAAHGLGFGSMLTSGRALGTASFSQAFNLAVTERAVCFVSIGTPTEVRRRLRPRAGELVTAWKAPTQ
jgi:nitroreductase